MAANRIEEPVQRKRRNRAVVGQTLLPFSPGEPSTKAMEGNLRKLSRVVEQTDDSVVITDREGRIEYVNPAFQRQTGYSREESLGKTPAIVKSGRHGQEFYKLMWDTIRSGNVFRGVLVNRKKSGEFYYEEKTITPLTDDLGSITHYVSTGKDITERMRAEEERSRLAAILEATTDLVAITTLEGLIVYLNRSGRELLGLEEGANARNFKISEIYPEWARALIQGEGIPAALRDGVWSADTAFLDRRGNEIAVSQVILAHRSAEGEVAYLSTIARDIRDRKAQIANLEFQATHDPLTGLPNRTLFLDRLNYTLLAGLREREPLALLIIDLDRFKNINDTLGHEAGDLVLQQLSHRLLGVLRQSDTVARVGGDEFAVILPDVDIAGAELTAKKILKAVEPPIEVKGKALSVRVSIGVSGSPEDGTDAASLVRNADAAMYSAKRRRSGCALFRSLPADSPDSKGMSHDPQAKRA